jgi:hypothetical protein
MIDFQKFANKRQQVKGAKYLLPDGTNSAMKRNNAMDVAEELADAVVIIRLWLQREDQVKHEAYLAWLITYLGELGQVMLNLSEYMADEIDVERVLPDE